MNPDIYAINFTSIVLSVVWAVGYFMVGMKNFQAKSPEFKTLSILTYTTGNIGLLSQAFWFMNQPDDFMYYAGWFGIIIFSLVNISHIRKAIKGYVTVYQTEDKGERL